MAVLPSCKICGGDTVDAGVCDFNKSGNDHFEGRRLFPERGQDVPHYRCADCGFVFTDFFDGWSHADFKSRVYNRDYHLADPPFETDRPTRLAAFADELFSPLGKDLSLLDYGGGRGRMVRQLKQAGFESALSYDPFYEDAPTDITGRRFDIVTCFEVVEHIPDQRNFFNDLLSHVGDEGVCIFSTLLVPDDMPTGNIADWWYVCPRNGHLSFHTTASLNMALAQQGFAYTNLSRVMHMAARGENTLTRHITTAFAQLSVKVLDSED